jgi:hypothetical protein
MKMKRLPRTTKFGCLEEELQYIRSGTGRCSAGLLLICEYRNFGSVVLVVLSILSFSHPCSCPLSLRSSALVSQFSVRNYGRLSVVTDLHLSQ